MLDGLLGRGFASKCKSLIKLTKSRIDVLRRKRNATLKFLKKDIADLLANGLDINAYGRAAGLLDELRLSWNLDFVEKSCDFVLKHLPVMQKQRECPEDCREAVSSLMFAAAGFSELPELRDLRHIFHERYGDSLDLFVNQEFSGNLLSQPFSMEKKIKLLEDIASEFSMPWDSRAFEQRMSKPKASVPDQPKKYGSFSVTDGEYKSTNGKDTILKANNRDVPSKERLEQTNDGYRLFNGKEGNVSTKNELVFQYRQEVSNERHRPLYEKAGTFLMKANHEKLSQVGPEVSVPGHEPWNVKEDSAFGTARSTTSSKRRERLNAESKLPDGREKWENTVPIRDSECISSHGKADITPYAGLQLKSNCEGPFGGNNSGSNGNYNNASLLRRVQEEDMHKPKSYFNNALPPPYVKPNVKPKDRGEPLGYPHPGFDGNAVPEDPSSRNKSYAGSRSERIQESSNHPDNDRHVIANIGVDSHGHDKNLSYYEGDGIGKPLPKLRSMRRRHSKSTSSHDNAEDVVVVRRKSRSRRRDSSRRGLQILFDDEHHQKDEEERIIDKLLLHYSKKPSSYDEEGKVRSKSKGHGAYHVDTNESDTPHNRGRDGSDDTVALPVRSTSLPHEQAAPSEKAKVFARAASFQPDRSNPARHVHPKLPDYDDLAARFAALKGR